MRNEGYGSRRARALTLATVAVVVLALSGCGESEQSTGQHPSTPPRRPKKTKLIVLHAASLVLPFSALEKAMEARHPGLDVIRESSSSRLAIRKVTDLNLKADILASADEALIRGLMIPSHADWVGVFARNRVVVAYTDRSRHRDIINEQNWFDILVRDDVNFGYADPNMAPVGYRTLLCWKLADLHYADALQGKSIYEMLRKATAPNNVRPHCNELIPLLQSAALDYTFQYRSLAVQHRLSFLKLPEDVDLGSEKEKETYAKVKVKINGMQKNTTSIKTGKPILYGITMVKDGPNPEMAIEFLQLLLSDEGAEVMEKNFQEVVRPAVCPDLAVVPEALRPLMIQVSP